MKFQNNLNANFGISLLLIVFNYGNLSCFTYFHYNFIIIKRFGLVQLPYSVSVNVEAILAKHLQMENLEQGSTA